MGGAAVRNLRHFGYPGRVFAVNAGRPSAPDQGVYASLAECPERPDALVVAVPAEPAMAVVTEAVAREVPAVILVSAGFGELAAGEGGAARARRLAELLAGSRTRLLGPNTAGLADFTHRFVPRAVLNSPDDIRPGPVAIVTQSGALSNTLLARLHTQGLGIGLCVATGDEADLRVDHWLRYVAGRDDLRTVVWVVEGVRDGPATQAALAALWAAGKQVIVLHVGGSEVGQAVAATHTGALAADGDVLKALCLRYGAVWADGIDDACRLATLDAAFPPGGPPPGDPLRVLLVCGSGGEAAMLADAYSAAGVALPPPSAGFSSFVAERFAFAKAANPFDLTGQTLSTPGLLVETIQQALREDEVDLVHVALPVFRDELGAGLYAGLAEALAGTDRPLVASLWTCPGLTDQGWRTWRETRAAVTSGSDGVPSALRRLADAKRRRYAGGGEGAAPAPAGRSGQAGCELAPDVLPALADRLAAHGIVATADAARLAEAIGLRVPDTYPAEEFAADPRPGTFYVKGYEKGVIHKRRHGLVTGPLATPEAVRAALADGAARRPAARWFAERAVDAEIALMVSCRRDPVAGWAILLGVGGGLTELFPDAVVTVLGVHRPADALAEVRRSRLGRYLDQAGGDPGVVDEALVRLVGGLRRHAAAVAARFAVVELNPVLVDGRTGDRWCVDVVVQS
jgi:acyl-CoA synthetase (NDP forming)